MKTSNIFTYFLNFLPKSEKKCWKWKNKYVLYKKREKCFSLHYVGLSPVQIPKDMLKFKWIFRIVARYRQKGKKKIRCGGFDLEEKEKKESMLKW